MMGFLLKILQDSLGFFEILRDSSRFFEILWDAAKIPKEGLTGVFSSN